jgi:hypothetical protein
MARALYVVLLVARSTVLPGVRAGNNAVHVMKTLADLARIMGVLLLCGQLHAQTAPSSPATGSSKTNTTPAIPATAPPVEPVTAQSLETTADTLVDVSTSLRDGRIVTTEEVERAIKLEPDPLRPVERPEYTKISPEVRQKLIEFQKTRERYLQEQQRLIKEFKGASEDERDRIRDLIRNKRERWLDQSRRIREDARERTV